MSLLCHKKCSPCEGNTPAFTTSEKVHHLGLLSSHWSLRDDEKKLVRTVKTRDFVESLKLANLLGELAEQEWHHPRLTVGYSQLVVEIWTHKIDNLVESDFIFAAKSDEILKNFS